MKKEKRKHLFYLNELDDYKVKDEDPDVRGWKVKDKDKRVIGTVNNLLVNKDKKKVVYLDIEVDESIIEANHDPYGKPSSEGVHEFINKDGEDHLIVPVGMVTLQEDEETVLANQVDYSTFAKTKRIKPGENIDRDYEVLILESYNRSTENEVRDSKDEEFYDRSEFDRAKYRRNS